MHQKCKLVFVIYLQDMQENLIIMHTIICIYTMRDQGSTFQSSVRIRPQVGDVELRGTFKDDRTEEMQQREPTTTTTNNDYLPSLLGS